MGETLVDLETVAEFIGLEPVDNDEPVRAANVAINIGLLNLSGRKYADVLDLERMLRLFGSSNPPLHELLNSVADQLVAAAGLERRMV